MVRYLKNKIMAYMANMKARVGSGVFYTPEWAKKEADGVCSVGFRLFIFPCVIFMSFDMSYMFRITGFPFGWISLTKSAMGKIEEITVKDTFFFKTLSLKVNGRELKIKAPFLFLDGLIGEED